MTRVPTDPQATAFGSWGRDYQYYWSGSGADFVIRGSLEGTPVRRTHSYPGGGTCNGAPTYPVCGWYDTCVYAGFSNPTDCNKLGASLSD